MYAWATWASNSASCPSFCSSDVLAPSLPLRLLSFELQSFAAPLTVASRVGAGGASFHVLLGDGPQPLLLRSSSTPPTLALSAGLYSF